jgi:Uma2 family endonuclease
MRPESRTKLTYDDFVLFPDDGMRHELIDGEHYVTPSPNFVHQRIVGNIYFFIRTWLEEHAVGTIYLSPLDVVISRFDVVEPDLLYISNERAAQVSIDTNIRGVPELVIEVGSPSTRKRDETIKRRLYDRARVSEYWVVDPDVEVVRVYRAGEQGFAKPVEWSLEAGDVVTTPLLAGLELPLSKIFEV